MPPCSLQGRGSTVEETRGVSPASATKLCMGRGDVTLPLLASTSLTQEKTIMARLQPSILHRQQESLRGERQRRETEERWADGDKPAEEAEQCGLCHKSYSRLAHSPSLFRRDQTLPASPRDTRSLWLGSTSSRICLNSKGGLRSQEGSLTASPRNF